MKILILISFLSLLGAIIGIDGFLFCICSLLLLPVLYFSFGIFFVNALNAYFAFMVAIVLVTALYRYLYIAHGDRFEFSNSEILSRLESSLLFSILFVIFYSLSLLWPDFYSLGERIRDLALIGAGVADPVFIHEPWMSGIALNYYAYWYRFAHIFSVLLNYKHWQIYHLMVSFAPSFLSLSIYLLLKDVFAFERKKSFFIATLLLFCSNPAGVYYFFITDANWWYPSRVITGTIGEFPAWSFLLGDAHPHFLNSGTLFFFIYLCFLAFKTKQNIITMLIFSLLLPILFFQNANLWEMPVWVAVFASVVFILSVLFVSERNALKDLFSQFSVINYKFLSTSLIFCFLAVCLYQMKKNFVPIPLSVKFVTDPVQGSAPKEFFMHWGFFLVPITLLLLSKTDKYKYILSGFLISLLLYKNILPFLVALWFINLWRIWREANLITSHQKVFLEAITFSALSLLIVPELIYLDDPYGAEIERMNTFFKISYVNWTMMFLTTCYLFKEKLLWKVLLPFALLSTAFFILVVPERAIEENPDPRGVNFLDKKYLGLKALIGYLDTQVPGTVLEAQGPPYSETSMVATLANFPAYLGWINHLDLLMPDKRDEISRRSKITESIYSAEVGCQDRSRIMLEEDISYLVLGDLELKSYPNLPNIDVSCLNQVFGSGNYKLFSNFQVK